MLFWNAHTWLQGSPHRRFVVHIFDVIDDAMALKMCELFILSPLNLSCNGRALASMASTSIPPHSPILSAGEVFIF